MPPMCGATASARGSDYESRLKEHQPEHRLDLRPGAPVLPSLCRRWRISPSAAAPMFDVEQWFEWLWNTPEVKRGRANKWRFGFSFFGLRMWAKLLFNRLVYNYYNVAAEGKYFFNRYRNRPRIGFSFATVAAGQSLRSVTKAESRAECSGQFASIGRRGIRSTRTFFAVSAFAMR